MPADSEMAPVSGMVQFGAVQVTIFLRRLMCFRAAEEDPGDAG